MKDAIELMEVTDIHLDPQNPRLPEDLVSTNPSQSELLAYLIEFEVVEEVAESIKANGFFPHEPLIVTEWDAPGFVVLEGNRRLAALMLVLSLPVVDQLEIPHGIDATDEQRERVRQVPVRRVSDRDAVRDFLGFRHIGGLQKWKPEAKARYLRDDVRRAVDDGVSEDPFRYVGRRVGSNAQGVRNPYLALELLVFAREELGLDVRHVQFERFGVWNRAMNAAELREYLGIGTPRTYDEVTSAVAAVDQRRLTRVLNDLTPASGRGSAVVSDSRDITAYGLVLANDDAREVLDATHDLQLARQIVEHAELPARIGKLAATVKTILTQIHHQAPSGELMEAVEELRGVVRTLHAAVASQQDD